jgi:arginine/lysine/ornithine decarboxylase
VQTPGRISPRAVQTALGEHPDCRTVFLTSPDYFGALCNISAISKICREKNVALLVDNAHGAHLGLFSGLHPMALGADACCDSLHKTLPALTGAALLHLRDEKNAPLARRRMMLFGSTSPSYLIQLSADMLAPRLTGLREGAAALAANVAALKAAAQKKGVWATAGPCDPWRISLVFPEGGRAAALSLMARLAIEPEYVSARHIVLLPGPATDFSRLHALVGGLSPCRETPSLPRLPRPARGAALREAVLAGQEYVPLGLACGRVAASPAAPCPPGLALVMPGEEIDAACVEALKFAGLAGCYVVK